MSGLPRQTSDTEWLFLRFGLYFVLMISAYSTVAAAAHGQSGVETAMIIFVMALVGLAALVRP